MSICAGLEPDALGNLRVYVGNREYFVRREGANNWRAFRENDEHYQAGKPYTSPCDALLDLVANEAISARMKRDTYWTRDHRGCWRETARGTYAQVVRLKCGLFLTFVDETQLPGRSNVIINAKAKADKAIIECEQPLHLAEQEARHRFPEKFRT